MLPENVKTWASCRQHGANSSILEEMEQQRQLHVLRIVKYRRYFVHVVRAQNLSTSVLHGHTDGTRPKIDTGQTTSGSALVYDSSGMYPDCRRQSGVESCNVFVHEL